MPRKATNHVQETRHTLGDLERVQLKKIVVAETFKDYGQFAQGAGLVLIGGGVVIASLVGVLKFAPQMFRWSKNGISNVLNDVAASGGVLDEVTDSLVKGNPISDRRAAQALARKRGRIAQSIDVFCTTSSDEYSREACSQAQADKDSYFQELYAFNDTVHVTYKDAFEDSNNYNRVINFIYKGLGDIDPRHSSRTDRHGKEAPYESRSESGGGDRDTSQGSGTYRDGYNPYRDDGTIRNTNGTNSQGDKPSRRDSGGGGRQ